MSEMGFTNPHIALDDDLVVLGFTEEDTGAVVQLPLSVTMDENVLAVEAGEPHVVGPTQPRANIEEFPAALRKQLASRPSRPSMAADTLDTILSVLIASAGGVPESKPVPSSHTQPLYMNTAKVSRDGIAAGFGEKPQNPKNVPETSDSSRDVRAHRATVSSRYKPG